MNPLKIGLVGSGFIARTRARCYRKAAGKTVELAGIVSADPKNAEAFASKFGVRRTYEHLDALLDSDVDIVDLCVPNHLHRPFAERASSAGKHIICTKPLTAYVGQDLQNLDDIGRQSMSARYEHAVSDGEQMVDAARRAGVKLMYGENWIYAPSIVRAASLLATSYEPILEMRGWEGHNGSHSPYSKQWKYTGGGALLRLGSHPIATMLYLKRREGIRLHGQETVPVTVSAQTKDLTRATGFNPDRADVAHGWIDVENWGCAIITFSDNTVGVAYGSDVMLGGMESKVELLTANAHFKCNLSPNDQLLAYTANPDVLGDAYLIEKSSTSAGWSSVMPDEDWTSGQQGMINAFLRDVEENRAPESDGRLGLDVVKTIYAAYVSASEGKSVDIPGKDV